MERHIDIPGAHNFRDLGGYTTNDGGAVKWRVIYRSGLLSRIKDEGLDMMKALALRTICDFRTLDEQKSAPDKWHDLHKLNKYSLPIGEGRVDKLAWLKTTSLENDESHHLYRANRSYVIKHTEKFRQFFEILLDDTNYPILYHCTAGKDRTGFASMLLLHVLGVEWNIIISDYLLTNKYLSTFADKVSENLSKSYSLDKAKVRSIFEAKEDYLKGALKAISSEYDSMDNYIKNALRIGPLEIKQLKRLLLEY